MVRRSSIWRGLAAVALAALAAAIAPTLALAKNVAILDAHAETPGHVIEDASGAAYVAWTRPVGPIATPEFCKIPRGGTCTAPVNLPIPGAGSSATEAAAGAFPVFGEGSVVYVVAPRYLMNDVVLYTSPDGGATFGPGQLVTGAYSSKTDPTDVIRVGSEFLIGGYNAGIGFSSFNTSLTGLGGFSFEEPGAGGVAASSFALDAAGNPVEAYYNLTSPPYPIEFYRAASPARNAESGWVGPTVVGNGYEPRLAGGASGLLLLSQDYTSASAKYPSSVDVRKYTGSSFGPPVVLFNDANSDLYAGGAIAQSPDGHVAVAWPQFSPSAEMRVLISSNGGASFASPSVVASIGSAYSDQVNAQVAIDNDGGGWVTFLSSLGLQLADITTGAGPGAATIGSDVVTLAGPTGCVKAGSPITGRLTVKSAKRKHKVVLKIYQVKFAVDGAVFKTLARPKVRKTGKVDPRPYVASVVRTLPAGSTHTLSSQAFISEKHGKHASRTLHVSFTVCS
jgi:hypothetical protein